MSISSIPITTEEPCSRCAAECCKYVTVPVQLDDSEYIRYLFYHGGSIIASLRKGTQALFPTRCVNLGADNRCMDYDNRPEICRSHTSDACIDNPDDGTEYRLKTYAQYEEFLNIRKDVMDCK